MWNETKQQQLNYLQQREAAGELTDEEKRALEQLLSELEQEEWQALKPSLERLRGEQIELQQNIGQTNTQSAILSAISLRQNDLLERAKTQLTVLRSEHEALRAERARIEQISHLGGK